MRKKKKENAKCVESNAILIVLFYDQKILYALPLHIENDKWGDKAKHWSRRQGEKDSLSNRSL